MAAFLISLPHTLYQIWAFVAPALYQNEKRLITPLVLSSVSLFSSAWHLPAFGFPRHFQIPCQRYPCRCQYGDRHRQIPRFILGMFVAFGTTFEVPVVILLAKLVW